MASSFNLMNWLRKRHRTILWIVIGGFVASMFVGFGLYLQTGKSSSDAVIEVNGVKISYRSFLNSYNRAIAGLQNQHQQITPEIATQTKQKLLQEIAQQEVLFAEAKRYGIAVSDAQLASFLAGVPAFQKNGKFDPQSYLQALQFGIHSSAQDFEDFQKKEMANTQLRQIIQEGIKITDKELELNAGLHIMSQPPEKRAEEAKKIQADPETFRQQLREQKINQMLEQWSKYLNSNLQVKVNLDQIERRQGR